MNLKQNVYNILPFILNQGKPIGLQILLGIKDSLKIPYPFTYMFIVRLICFVGFAFITNWFLPSYNQTVAWIICEFYILYYLYIRFNTKHNIDTIHLRKLSSESKEDKLENKEDKIESNGLLKQTSSKRIERNLKFKIAPILIARVMDQYLIWTNMEKIADWLPSFLAIEEILLPLYFSYHIFDLTLATQGKSFGFRLNYFKDRWPYYMGYGFLMALTHYLGRYDLHILALIIATESTATIKEVPKHPKYARWLPHNGEKYNTDIDEILESGLLYVYEKFKKLFKK